MKKRTNFISIALCILTMLTIVFAARAPVSGTTGPLLYWNDRNWIRESRQGIEKIYETYYVPVTLFNQLDNVEVLTNKTFKTFIISNGDKFISFDTVSDFALNHEDVRFYLKSFQLHGDYYVPAEAVCEFLDLGYEELKSSVTGEVAVRITDGNQKNSFEALLRSKYPAFFEAETDSSDTAPHDTTTPNTTPPVTVVTDKPPEPLTDRTIYLTVEDCPGEYTDEILELLAEYGCKATFFVTGELMLAEPATLSRITAEGHEIALHTVSHDASLLTDADTILADIEYQNELLAALIKQKSHIWRAPEGSAKLPVLTPDVLYTLGKSGIVVWDYNIDAGTSAKLSTSRQRTAINNIIKGIRKYETPIIRFVEGESTVAVLRGVLDFIAENRDVCHVYTINPSMSEYNVVEW